LLIPEAFWIKRPPAGQQRRKTAFKDIITAPEPIEFQNCKGKRSVFEWKKYSANGMAYVAEDAVNMLASDCADEVCSHLHVKAKCKKNGSEGSGIKAAIKAGIDKGRLPCWTFRPYFPPYAYGP
jgi:hypothetical protein